VPVLSAQTVWAAVLPAATGVVQALSECPPKFGEVMFGLTNLRYYSRLLQQSSQD